MRASLNGNSQQKAPSRLGAKRPQPFDFSLRPRSHSRVRCTCICYWGPGAWKSFFGYTSSVRVVVVGVIEELQSLCVRLWSVPRLSRSRIRASERCLYGVTGEVCQASRKRRDFGGQKNEIFISEGDRQRRLFCLCSNRIYGSQNFNLDLTRFTSLSPAQIRHRSERRR